MELGRKRMVSGKGNAQLVEKWEQRDHQFYFYCAEVILEISIYAANILRFRFSPEGRFEDDFSYAIAHKGPIAAPEIYYAAREVSDEIEIVTPELRLSISKTLHIRIFDQEGNLINEDERGFYWEPSQQFGGNSVFCNKRIQKEECFFGLGDKPNNLNIRGMRFETWGSDAYGFERTSDPLYKNIPFFLGLHAEKAYGIFFDNTFRTVFDFGYSRGDVCSFSAPGGEMNYYFIFGPSLTRVTEGYSFLTGTPDMPPRWALGYHQSKWSYAPEENVRDLARQLRDHEIPCDAIHLDIEYMEGFRCFTWDKTKFPDPKQLTSDLEEDGFKTVLILDPGIKIDPGYKLYESGLEKDVFCRRGDGPLMKGEVWPGDCHFPDFTRADVRDWWIEQFDPYIEESGVRGIWNDMNEPAVLEVGTFPMDTRHDYDGHPCSHRKAHNVYGMQMSRASYHGLKKALDPLRIFMLTRSGYSGFHRYAATWTGDNLSTWEHLWMANIQVQRLSVSGVSFAGSDVGGFIGKGSGELLVRWMQLGAFHPFFRNHSSGDHGNQEPWVFGEPYTSAIRSAIQLRYKLLPYLYTQFWKNHTFGTPIVQPLSFLAQDDQETHYRMEEFGLGRDLLVCPINSEGAKGRRIYLPEGYWYNFWTDEVVEGKQEVWVESALDTFPLFVKAGAIIPLQEVMNYVDERPLTHIELHIYIGPGSYTSQLYEDAGEYGDYKDGATRIRSFSINHSQEGIRIRQFEKGEFESQYSQFQIHMHGLSQHPSSIKLDGEILEDRMIHHNNVFIIAIPKDFEVLTLS
ncbi:MAG: glycoside hydrolase family 31 protein [Bacteroidota bacterium]